MSSRTFNAEGDWLRLNAERVLRIVRKSDERE
jgi:hypothetical protein